TSFEALYILIGYWKITFQNVKHSTQQLPYKHQRLHKYRTTAIVQREACDSS
ncbi:MAG: hypothetical protein ACI83B_003022, partial [Sediminicola sp.]